MDQQDVLQHLLEVEASAASLVADAQTESDNRIAEAEKQSRFAYNEVYGKRVGELEEDYTKSANEIENTYSKLLQQYHVQLDSLPVNREAFNLAVAGYLFGDQ